MSIEPKELCGTCGGKPRLSMCDRDGKTADIICGWCRQCGRLGPMRSEVDDACAAWDADQARKCESIEATVFEYLGHFEIPVTENEMKRIGVVSGDRVIIVRKGGKA